MSNNTTHNAYEIFAAVAEECARLSAMSGDEAERPLLQWLTMMGSDVSIAAQHAVAGDDGAAIATLLRAISVGVLCVEEHGMCSPGELATMGGPALPMPFQWSAEQREF